jgi:hypothetical protein
MPAFSIGDIVRVARQPDDILLHIVGKVGYIDELNETYVIFMGLKLNGSMSGCGSVQLDCLEHENSAQWKQAKELRDAKAALSFAESKARSERYAARMAELSAQYGISVENAKALNSDIEALSSRDWWPE